MGKIKSKNISSRKKNFFNYKNVDLFKPNLKELNSANHSEIIGTNISKILESINTINERLDAKIVMITLSKLLKNKKTEQFNYGLH